MKFLIVAALLLASAASGADEALKAQPGYVDFGDLSALDGGEPTVEISLGSALLSFLAAATREEDAELADTLGKLRSIRLTVFEVAPESFDEARARAERVGRELEARAWDPAVVVKSEGRTIRMYLKLVEDRVAGMAVMIIEPGEEAVFMNIVGEIDPAQLGRVASKFGVSIEDLGG